MRLIVIVGRAVIGRSGEVMRNEQERKSQKPDLWPQKPQPSVKLEVKEASASEKPSKRPMPEQRASSTFKDCNLGQMGNTCVLGKTRWQTRAGQVWSLYRGNVFQLSQGEMSRGDSGLEQKRPKVWNIKKGVPTKSAKRGGHTRNRMATGSRTKGRRVLDRGIR